MRKRLYFVVPFFLDGNIVKVRLYSDVMRAQAALRRYVGYSELAKEIKAASPGISRQQLMLESYGAITKTRHAGTEVFEVALDEAKRRKRQQLGTSRIKSC